MTTQQKTTQTRNHRSAPRQGLRRVLVLLYCLLPASFVSAHHSFAVHFIGEPEGMIEVTGVVDEFRFSNPHAVLSFTVTTASGEKEAWRAETNSPSVLRRRGWSKDSLKAGDEVTILGFPARDGSAYMRISRVRFADGRELLGQAAAAPVEDQE